MPPPVAAVTLNEKAVRFRPLAALIGTPGRRLALAGMTLVLVFGVLWYNQHRKISWRQTLSPAYWLLRWRGGHLYDAGNAVLLHGNPDLPEIALTFDDGPHIESRARILDILKANHIHAVFFDVGKRMAENPELLRRTLAEGHEVGNHSYWHNRLDELKSCARHREINDTDVEFYRITGQHLHLLRPPGVRYNDDVLAMTKELGYIVVHYTTASHDFLTDESPDFIASRTIQRTENGSILLLHDYPHTADALPKIIQALQQKGYRFVTVSEMIAHLPERLQASAEQFLEQHDDAPRQKTARLPGLPVSR